MLLKSLSGPWIESVPSPDHDKDTLIPVPIPFPPYPRVFLHPHPQGHDFSDWWWKARLGKCYYQLGLLRDAESQFASSLKNQEMISTVQVWGEGWCEDEV